MPAIPHAEYWISDFGFRISNFEFDVPRPASFTGKPQSAWRRRIHRRCLASRHDVVLNIMAACLASSRGSTSPEHKHGRGHIHGRTRPGSGSGWARESL